MALDDERGDAQIAEQQGARQPDQAPADDQHRCLLVRHVRLLSVQCGDAIRGHVWWQLSSVTGFARDLYVEREDDAVRTDRWLLAAEYRRCPRHGERHTARSPKRGRAGVVAFAAGWPTSEAPMLVIAGQAAGTAFVASTGASTTRDGSDRTGDRAGLVGGSGRARRRCAASLHGVGRGTRYRARCELP